MFRKSRRRRVQETWTTNSAQKISSMVRTRITKFDTHHVKKKKKQHMPLLQCSPWSTALGLLKIDIGEVLDTISDPNIPAESVLLGAAVVPSSPGGTKWHAARYFLSDRMLA